MLVVVWPDGTAVHCTTVTAVNELARRRHALSAMTNVPCLKTGDYRVFRIYHGSDVVGLVVETTGATDKSDGDAHQQ